MPQVLRYGVISDTHGRLPAEVFPAFENVERIYHCGDIGAEACIKELETIAPVVAVAGNMDPWPLAGMHADSLTQDEAFGTVALCHGMHYGHTNARIAQGLLELFADAHPRAILFGHSHQFYCKTHGKTLVLNPGSASLPQSGSPRSVAILEYDPHTARLSALRRPLDPE